MRATELCTVDRLRAQDILQLGSDPSFYGVVAIEQAAASGGTWRVSLKNLATSAVVTLVRSARDQVLMVPRGQATLPGSAAPSGPALA